MSTLPSLPGFSPALSLNDSSYPFAGAVCAGQVHGRDPAGRAPTQGRRPGSAADDEAHLGHWGIGTDVHVEVERHIRDVHVGAVTGD